MKRDTREGVPFALAAAVLAVVLVVILVLIVVLIGILILVAVLAVILILVLVTVLIIHSCFPPKFSDGLAAKIVCPELQDLSFALKHRLAIRPAVIAAEIPPAEDFRPPVKIPRKPSV